MWVGFCVTESVVPSPKSQVLDVIVPREESVNLTVNGIVPERVVGFVWNPATSPTFFTVMVLLSVVVPLVFLAVRVAV